MSTYLGISQKLNASDINKEVISHSKITYLEGYLWDLDDAQEAIKKAIKIDVIKPKFKNRKIVLEGGSIDVNGNGLLMTTKQCLVSKIQERNKGFETKDYEKIFKKFLGVNKIIWLNNGIEGDDTPVSYTHLTLPTKDSV